MASRSCTENRKDLFRCPYQLAQLTQNKRSSKRLNTCSCRHSYVRRNAVMCVFSIVKSFGVEVLPEEPMVRVGKMLGEGFLSEKISVGKPGKCSSPRAECLGFGILWGLCCTYCGLFVLVGLGWGGVGWVWLVGPQRSHCCPGTRGY